MKSGEYNLHVLVQSTSSLSLDNQSDLDVRLAIKAFGETKYSEVKKDVGVEDTFWGEHFYFEKVFDNSLQLNNQRINLAVYDHSRITADSLIGTYDIDVVKVYEEDDHRMEHFWCGLVNVEQDFSVITGYIKVSVCVIGQGDKNQQLLVQPIESIGADRKILIPPNVQRKTYQIVADIVQAIDISPIDNGSVDSYIGLEFGQSFEITEPIGRNCNPKYNSRLYLPMHIPSGVTNIVIRINDFNIVQRGTVIGSHYINIDNLLKNYIGPSSIPSQSHINKNLQYLGSNLQWINFYGPQIHAEIKQYKNLHQFFPEMATSYVGSVLMRISLEESGDTQKRCEKLDDKAIQHLLKIFISSRPVFYRITARITAAMNLYNKNKKYKVIVQVGNIEVQTEYQKAQNGFCVWNSEISFSVKAFNNQTVPDIFIYLVNHKDKKICYLRYPASDHPRYPILEDKWVNLNPDLSMVDYKLEEGGLLKLGLTMMQQNSPIATEYKKIKNQMAQLHQKNQLRNNIIIQLISGHSLIPLDEDGSADPFFVFSFMNAQVSSSLKNDTLNPNYLEILNLKTDIPEDEESCPPIIVNAYDKDKLSKQLIGTAILDLGDLLKDKALTDGNKKAKPKQFPLKQNNIICGYFTASFTFLRKGIGNVQPEIKLKCRKFKMILVALGLRGLKSSGIFPVRRPQIEFDFQSLSKFYENNKILKKRVLEIQDSGSQIKIYKPLIETLYLPEDLAYWPMLSAVVRNRGIGKIYKSILGYCSINLKQAFLQSKNLQQLMNSRRRIISNKKRNIDHRSQKLKCLSNTSILALRNFIFKASNYQWKVLNDKMILNRLQTPEIQATTSRRKRQINPQYIVLFPHYVRVQGQRDQQEPAKQQKNKKKNILSHKKNSSIGPHHYIEKYQKFILNNSQYMAIGYDSNERRNKNLNEREKHYRFVLNMPYQKYMQWSQNTKLSLMGETEIRRGRKNFKSKSSNIVNSLIRKISNEDMKNGLFKADILLIDQENENSQKQDLFLKQSKAMVQKVMKKQKIKMFLYIIDARNLPSRDTFNKNDSYIVVKIGSTEFDFSSENTIKDTLNPRFNQKVVADLSFPENAIMNIQVWDNDPLKSDQMIGSVTIDLQNRLQFQFFNQTWNNPIETHDIMYPTSKLSKGILRFWLDLVPADMVSIYREFDITDKPPSQFQIRLIVWSVQGMPNNDFQDMNDLYVVCQFGDEVQETDVHYRTANGEGYFNWRMKFPIKMPANDYHVTLKVYDKDVFSRNDYLASCSFSIEEYLREAFQTDTSTRLFLGRQDLAKNSDVKTGKSRMIDGQKRYDRFWVETVNRNIEEEHQSNQRVALRKVGKVQISIQILTQKDAKKRPAGKGRQDPNQNPFLPEPKNRMVFTLNPVKMIGQLCGQKFKVKIIVGIILLLLITTGIYFLSSFWGGFVGGATSNITKQ